MENRSQTSARSWVLVFTAGAFFFYSFIQMALLGLNDPTGFGNFAATFLYGTVLFLIPAGVLLDRVPVRKLVLASIVLVVACVECSSEERLTPTCN